MLGPKRRTSSPSELGLSLVIVGALAFTTEACSGDCPSPDPPSWDECRARPADGDCSLTLELSIARVTGDPFIECDGFGVDIDDPCGGTGWPGLLSTQVRDGRYSRTFFPAAFTSGNLFNLEAEMRGADGGVARFCRVFYTDVHEEGSCGEWQCATSGTIVLSDPIGAVSPSAVRGSIDAVFPGGESVRAEF